MERVLPAVHEMAGVGTLFPDEHGQPVLHLHAAFGRDDRTTAGCIRCGVTTWVIGEVIVIEITASDAGRRVDPVTGSSCSNSGAEASRAATTLPAARRARRARRGPRVAGSRGSRDTDS